MPYEDYLTMSDFVRKYGRSRFNPFERQDYFLARLLATQYTGYTYEKFMPNYDFNPMKPEQLHNHMKTAMQTMAATSWESVPGKIKVIKKI